ncbi:BQ5605_C004g02941 [Microbotryum silenes-dioicae]|uniref:BQ5605_C004g02941 protein n=1 Tax=Microbotryum silenes-dioicae TaxID=796604 RepID=A0A2X0P4S7_9BASI|nr:BQ5605_C004g02941 [Microbotryum silenes-dioicae]
MASQSAISSQHSDLITAVRFSQHHRLATCSLDHTIRVTERDTTTGAYDARPVEWKAHDSPVLDLAWAEPQFGTVLASGAVDGSIKLWSWDHVKGATAAGGTGGATGTTVRGSSGATGFTATLGGRRASSSTKRWSPTAVLTDARGTIRSIEFAPAAFGLKLAAVSSDSHLRVWECLDPVTLSEWSLVNDIDLTVLTAAPSTAQSVTLQGPSLGVSTAGSSTINFPTPASATGVSNPSGSQAQSFDGFNASSSLLSGSDTSASPNRSGIHASVASSSLGTAAVSSMGSSASGGSFDGRKGGTIETDGGWSLSWCKEAWWGERLAVSSGTSGIIRLFHLPDHAPWSNFLNLIPARSSSSSSSYASVPPTASLAWAPASGRSYQLLASGSRDARARVWRIYPPSLDTQDELTLSTGEWRAKVDDELEDLHSHPKSLSRTSNRNAGASGIGTVKVGWNVTGTVLSTAGDDARVRLWKSDFVGRWQIIAVLSTEDAGDEEMEK